MFSSDTLEALIRSHGLLIMTPLVILEGPLVTVIAGYLARLHYFSLSAVFIMVLAVEVFGDILFYSLGRWVINADGQPPGWLARLGLTQARLEKMVKSFEHKGGRLLVIAKLTHSAGALVLTEGRQVIVEGWVQELRPGTAAARAAEAAAQSDRNDHA